VMVNLGLLERLTSVDQIAFVIAHELGHDVANHVVQELKRRSNSLGNEEFRKTLRRITHKQIGLTSNTWKLLNGYFANHMEFRRQNELTADSIGLIFMQKAGFRGTDALAALKILDESDKIRFTDTLKLEEHFSFENYPFKSYWLNSADTDPAWIADSLLYKTPDSLKSHPDCDVRMEKLTKQLIISTNRNWIDDSIELDNLHAAISFETLQSILQSENLALALYTSLHLEEQYPYIQYPKCVSAICLFELGQAMRRNEYLEYVDFPDKQYGPAYNKFLVFLHNMNSSTLIKLSNLYMTRYIYEVKDSRYAAYLHLILDTTKPISVSDISEFESLFNDPYLIAQLKKKSQEAIVKKN